MLNFLSRGSCSRRLYIIFVIAFIAFDFSKAPLTNYLLRLKEDVQQHIYLSDGAELARKFEAATAPVGVIQDEAERARLLDNTMSQVAEATAGAIAMEAKSSAVGSIFLSLLVVMGAGSWLALIWMILARLRDIRWPPAIGWAIIAMPVALRILNPMFSDAAWYAAQYLFFAAAAVLAVVPGHSDTTGGATTVAAAVPLKSGQRRQFGLRS